MHKEDSGPENGELLLLLLARMLTTYFNTYYVIHKTSFTSNIVDVVFFFFFFFFCPIRILQRKLSVPSSRYSLNSPKTKSVKMFNMKRV